MRNYCSLNDLFNPWRNSEDTIEVILKAESLFKSFLEKSRDTAEAATFFSNNLKFLTTLFPKMTILEFIEVTGGL